MLLGSPTERNHNDELAARWVRRCDGVPPFYTEEVRQALPDPAGLPGCASSGITIPTTSRMQSTISGASRTKTSRRDYPTMGDAEVLERLETYAKSEIGAIKRMLLALQAEILLPRDQAQLASPIDRHGRGGGRQEDDRPASGFIRQKGVPPSGVDAAARWDLAVALLPHFVVSGETRKRLR